MDILIPLVLSSTPYAFSMAFYGILNDLEWKHISSKSMTGPDDTMMSVFKPRLYPSHELS